MRTNILLSISTLFHVVPAAIAADANELIAIGAVQKGTVGAGVAFPQDATWALLNPASIVDLDRRLDISLEFLDIHRGIRPRGVPLFVNVSEVKMTDGSGVFIPSFGMIWPLERGTLGFGVHGIQGSLIDFRAPRTTLAIPDNSDRRSQLEIARIPLSYGYRFDNGWAVGGSLVGVVSRFRTDSLTLKLRPTEGDFEWDYALGIGVQLGVYKRWNRVAVGAAWRSRQAVQQYDKYDDVIRWNLDLPQTLQAGVALQLTDKLHLLADYKWQQWSALKQQAEQTVRGGLGWEDQHIFKLGLVYALNDKWTLRAGASHGNSPIPDEFVFANSTGPGISEDHVAVGFSYAITERSTLHLAWEHSFPKEREENGEGDLFSILGKGTRASLQEDGVVVQYSFKF